MIRILGRLPRPLRLTLLALLLVLLACSHLLAATGAVSPWLPWTLLLPCAALHLDWSLDDAPAQAHRLLRWATCLAWLLLVTSPVLFSDDLWRYILDGRASRIGLSPFAYAPDHPKVADLARDLLPSINHAHMPTIYPPVAQGLFAIGAWNALTWKALLAVLVGLCAWWLSTTGTGRPQGWMLVTHPLVMVAAGGSGHVDAAGLLLVTAAFIALQGARPMLASAWLGVAASIKLFPVLLPALAGFGRPSIRTWALAALLPPLILAATYLPWLVRSAPALGSLAPYGATWTFHGAVHSWLLFVSTALLDWVGIPETLHLGGLWSLGRSGATAGYDGPLFLAREELAAQAVRLLTGVLLVGGGVLIGLSKVPATVRLLRVIGLFLLLSPVLHPWYVLWLLPLALALRSGWALFAAATSVLPWISTVMYLETEEWREVPGLATVHVLSVMAFGLWWHYRKATESVSAPAPSSLPDPDHRA